ncbi:MULTISPECIES: alkaline phosphatase D family protein [Acinetobacter]|uniref:Alkaline phosphatase D family protein n=1 Tax=Acinetobacter pittii TaxID=48296 RepID=A0AAE9SBI5_ACIPI|nr:MULTISPECIES: alkaline phosphatase D family protein [Acinetobacter calcoaceticus/baumannii complex]AZP28384.1 alkaline phosphatase [Acinetobacter pittii]EXC26135.1 phoD-like phosphatase family protein [Acinetobacter sp. 809848]EXE25087.1 phoD-like phosphatase family protein [Acinetobacter sp. 907131]EXS11972.1 phoD-like phosphatase family protein [Acinetobacter sp. 883425]MBK0411245.1 alkaline phosphatase D family protein [Acinetobacter pittii]
MSEKISRRELIQKSLFGFGALSLPVAFTGCNDGSDEEGSETQADFLHGVASGDPLQDKVILWTRLTPVDLNARLRVTWEIATDDQFKQNLKTGTVQTNKTDDFTVKVDATGLQAGMTYYYRFRFGSKVSPVGQTKTLPVTTNKVSFAVCSCSNYPAGYFYVYREMAKQNVDVVIHLGDYIYEYGADGYATEDAAKLGRTLPSDNNKEIIKLDDYRKRYALYRQDKDLQAVHQRHPFIVIWDDHELANDTWREGAENHQSNEGPFLERKLAALQAYFEWMPIRPVSSTDHLNIYRQFNFGSLVQLTMLDTRIIARDKQLEYKDYMIASGLDAQKFQADLTDPKRTLMGYTQRDWLVDKLQQSTATWNVVGQQVLMSKMWIPAELLASLGQITSGGTSSDTLAKMTAQITELVTLKLRLEQGDPTLTVQEKARVTTLVPYNLDAWDGYYAEREFLYDKLAEFNKKIIVLAGDTHNAWTSYLYSQKGEYIGVELATSSVSSPGLEKYLSIPLTQLQQFEFAFTTLIDELAFCNLNQRGYLMVTLDDKQVLSDWIFVDSIKNAEYKVDSSRSYQLVLDANLTPEKDKQKTA